MFHRKSVWLYLLPGLLGLLAFYVVPFVWGVWFSLTDGTIDNRFVGFSNYLRVWKNPVFQLGLKNTLELSLLCAPAIFLLSFLLAGMLRKHVAGDAFFRNALLLPYLMPSSAILIIWLLIFDYGGVINRLLVAVGAERVFWLEGEMLRLPIVLLYIWKNLGFSVVIFTAALQAVPEAMYEYASLEGADGSAGSCPLRCRRFCPPPFWCWCWPSSTPSKSSRKCTSSAAPIPMRAFTLCSIT